MTAEDAWKTRSTIYYLIGLVCIVGCSLRYCSMDEENPILYEYRQLNASFWPPDIIPHPNLPEPNYPAPSAPPPAFPNSIR